MGTPWEHSYDIAQLFESALPKIPSPRISSGAETKSAQAGPELLSTILRLRAFAGICGRLRARSSYWVFDSVQSCVRYLEVEAP